MNINVDHKQQWTQDIACGTPDITGKMFERLLVIAALKD